MVDLLTISRPFPINSLFYASHSRFVSSLHNQSYAESFTLYARHGLHKPPVPLETSPSIPPTVTEINATRQQFIIRGYFYALAVHKGEPQARPQLWLFNAQGEPVRQAFDRAEVRLVSPEFIYLMHEVDVEDFGLLLLRRNIMQATWDAIQVGNVTLQGHRPTYGDFTNLISPTMHNQGEWETHRSYRDIVTYAPGGIAEQEGRASFDLHGGLTRGDAQRPITSWNTETIQGGLIMRRQDASIRVREAYNAVHAYWYNLSDVPPP